MSRLLFWALFGAVCAVLALKPMQIVSTRVQGIPQDLLDKGPLAPYDAEIMRQITTAAKKSDLRVASATFGVFGAFVAAGLGMSRSWLNRLGIRRCLLSAIAGLVLGAVFGGIGGAVAVLLHGWWQSIAPLQGSFRAMSMHAAAWSVTATGVAMTTAVASKHYRGLPRLLIAAVLAGLTSAMLFVPLATILFPLQNSDMLVPAEFTGRLLFVSLAGMLMGLAAASSPFLTETGGHRAGTRQGGP